MCLQRNCIFIIALWGLFNTVCGGNILVFHLVATGSYKRMMDALLMTLTPHHNVTLYSIVHKEPLHSNMTLYPMEVPQPKNLFSSGLFEILCTRGTYEISWKTAMSTSKEFTDSILSQKPMQDLFASNESHYDLMITFATFEEYTLPFAHHFNIPLVQIITTTPLSYNNEAVGNHIFSTTEYQFFGHEEHDSFYNRVKIYLKLLGAHIRYYYWYMPMLNSIANKYYPPETPKIEEINRNTSLLLTNINSAMGYARPLMPHAIEIGGLHCKRSQPLPPDLEDFVSGSGERGIIYFSFGSSIRSKFPEYIRLAILRTFQKLPYRVLWKWNEDMFDVPPNVRVSKWYSQQDILGHNKTKLFITQSGMFSIQESAYHGVPVLAIPIAFDQIANAMLAQKLGYAKYIKFCEFSEEDFYSKVNELLSNPKYRQNAKRVSSLMKDQPWSISKKINWWIDYVIRHNGNPLIHQNPRKHFGFSRMDVDVVLFLVFCSMFALFSIVYLIYRAQKYFYILRNYIHIKNKSE